MHFKLLHLYESRTFKSSILDIIYAIFSWQTTVKAKILLKTLFIIDLVANRALVGVRLVIQKEYYYKLGTL